MVTIVKSEWHQVEKRFSIEVDEAMLSEIYPNLDTDEIVQKLDDLESGVIDFDIILSNAQENNVDLDFDWMDEDDWWTERKGGYDVTYNIEY
jgi:hypothetical protein